MVAAVYLVSRHVKYDIVFWTVLFAYVLLCAVLHRWSQFKTWNPENSLGHLHKNTNTRLLAPTRHKPAQPGLLASTQESPVQHGLLASTQNNPFQPGLLVPTQDNPVQPGLLAPTWDNIQRLIFNSEYYKPLGPRLDTDGNIVLTYKEFNTHEPSFVGTHDRDLFLANSENVGYVASPSPERLTGVLAVFNGGVAHQQMTRLP